MVSFAGWSISSSSLLSSNRDFFEAKHVSADLFASFSPARYVCLSNNDIAESVNRTQNQ